MLTIFFCKQFWHSVFLLMKLAQPSDQTTITNIIGTSDRNSATLKRKRPTTVYVSDSTPTSFSGKKTCSKQGVLCDITNILPSTVSTLPTKLQTPFTSGSCVSKISTHGIILKTQCGPYLVVCHFNCLTGG